MTITSNGHITFLGVNDINRVRSFYEEKLGLPCVAEDDESVVFDMGGTHLRITQVDNFKPQRFTVLGWSVPDIETEANKLKAAGIVPIHYPHLEQDKKGIATLGGARLLWFTDPAGNVLSLTES